MSPVSMPSTLSEFHQSFFAESVVVTLTVTVPDTCAPATGETIVSAIPPGVGVGVGRLLAQAGNAAAAKKAKRKSTRPIRRNFLVTSQVYQTRQIRQFLSYCKIIIANNSPQNFLRAQPAPAPGGQRDDHPPPPYGTSLVCDWWPATIDAESSAQPSRAWQARRAP